MLLLFRHQMSRMILSEIHAAEALSPKTSSAVVTIAPLDQEDPSSSSTISLLCLVISVVALIIVFLGILHLVFKFLQDSPTFSQIRSFNPNPDLSSSSPQLQHLFFLHNSGLDQTAVDALPVFLYGDVAMSLEQPFDCAVCLSEFSDMDKLRLLPVCSHAFHLHCIDTWLLSNSTCPLCRRSLSTSDSNSSRFCFQGVENCIVPLSCDNDQPHEEGKASMGERVFSVRLGRFKSTNASQSQSQEVKAETGVGVARRCYSMGRHQYLECNHDFVVSLSSSHREGRCGNSCSAHEAE